MNQISLPHITANLFINCHITHSSNTQYITSIREPLEVLKLISCRAGDAVFDGRIVGFVIDMALLVSAEFRLRSWIASFGIVFLIESPSPLQLPWSSWFSDTRKVWILSRQLVAIPIFGRLRRKEDVGVVRSEICAYAENFAPTESHGEPLTDALTAKITKDDI
jgi:hypothetical protein